MSTKDERIAELEAERDALAAHVERITDDIHELIGSSRGVAGLHLNGDLAPWDELTTGGRIEEWLMSLDDAPSTSLARRDALKQAEAVEEAADGLTYTQGLSKPARDWMAQRANNYRRQAEEAP